MTEPAEILRAVLVAYDAMELGARITGPMVHVPQCIVDAHNWLAKHPPLTKIRIQTGTGWIETEGETHGPFTLHAEPRGLASRLASTFVLSHAKTGHKIGCGSHETSLKIIELLKPLDWDFDDPKDPKLTLLKEPAKAAFAAVPEFVHGS